MVYKKSKENEMESTDNTDIDNVLREFQDSKYFHINPELGERYFPKRDQGHHHSPAVRVIAHNNVFVFVAVAFLLSLLVTSFL
jgi:hypothetical protein